MTPVPRLSHLLSDRLNHLVLELDDLHVGHHGPVLPVEDIQRLRDVPQPRDCLQPLVLKVRELSPGGHHTVHRDLRGASEYWHLHHSGLHIRITGYFTSRDWRFCSWSSLFDVKVSCVRISSKYILFSEKSQFRDYLKLHELSFLLLSLQPLRLSIKINVCSFGESESEFKLTTCYINF